MRSNDEPDWTVGALHAHLTRLLAEKDLRYQQRFDAQNDALMVVPPVAEQVAKLAVRVDGFDRLMEAKFVTFDTLIKSQADKVALALHSADTAVTKQEIAFEKRIEAVTETVTQLREALVQSVRADYLQQALDARDAADGAMAARIRELELARSTNTGQQDGGSTQAANQRANLLALISFCGFIVTLIGLIVVVSR